MTADTICPYCGVETGGGSHYHCPRCGGECSMMGHWREADKDYTCEEQDNDITRRMKAAPSILDESSVPGAVGEREEPLDVERLAAAILTEFPHLEFSQTPIMERIQRVLARLSVNEGGATPPVAAEHLLVKEVGHDEQAGTSSGADKSSDGAVGGRSSVSELRSEGGAGHGSGQPDDVLPLGEDRQVRLRPSVGGGAPVARTEAEPHE